MDVQTALPPNDVLCCLQIFNSMIPVMSDDRVAGHSTIAEALDLGRDQMACRLTLFRDPVRVHLPSARSSVG